MKTSVPALFMLVTTINAGIITIFNYYLPMNNFGGNLNAGLSFIMIVLVIIVFVETVRKMISVFRQVY